MGFVLMFFLSNNQRFIPYFSLFDIGDSTANTGCQEHGTSTTRNNCSWLLEVIAVVYYGDAGNDQSCPIRR